jgi:predicted RecB family nuclease
MVHIESISAAPINSSGNLLPSHLGANVMATKITREILEAFLNCKFKAHLKLIGQDGIRSDYEAMMAEIRQEVRQKAINKILARNPESELTRGMIVTVGALRDGPSFVLDAKLEDDQFMLTIDGLKKVDGPSQLGNFHYLPMLFHESRKIGKQQRLLLEIHGLLLSRLQGQMPSSGIIWHGKECSMTRVRLNGDLRNTERLVREVKEMVTAESPPKLVLNDHCQICEFRQRCHDQAVQQDNLSLLRGISEKEIKRFARKGIFSVTQLAHTFRPRRNGKQQVQNTHRHSHALQALAVREKRIYIFGTPELKASPVRIYVDMEGDPEQDYVYLIGIIIVQGEMETRHSFWADSKEDEWSIFQEFLAVISKQESFLLFCYGGYEVAFLRRMRSRKAPVDDLITASVNVLSLIYSHVYFPTYSNGLKDIGACLDCSWTEPDASGIQSVVWRKKWEEARAEEWKQKLTNYNLEDCAALKRVTETIYAAAETISGPAPGHDHAGSILPVAQVQDLQRWDNNRNFGLIDFVHPDFTVVNKCGYFDYQRQRVFVRSSRVLRKNLGRRVKNQRPNFRPTKVVSIIERKCPACASDEIVAWVKGSVAGCPIPRVRRAYDLALGSAGIKRQVIECHSSVHQCLKCRDMFIPEQYVGLDKHYHGLKSWVMYQHVGHNLSLRAIQLMLEEFFGLRLTPGELHMLKELMAGYYKNTYRGLLKKILSGNLVHIDETEVKLHSIKGYVWAFTNLEEVVFMYKPTREGDFLRELLKDFHGVLVSEFYVAYDSIDCPQQKCLIHLIRDMNQELLNNAFDSELRSITESFGRLLRSVVETIDQHGLKQRHLQRHKRDVDRFFQELSEQTYHSETADLLRRRVTKYQNKLFTFIDHDGVPWNNNNAENAIKRFAYYREGTVGMMMERGLSDYLVLLSICQTCRYKGVSFLRFLASGQRDIDSYCRRKFSRRWPVVQVYPNGFIPPHHKSRDRQRLLRRLEKAGTKIWSSHC